MTDPDLPTTYYLQGYAAAIEGECRCPYGAGTVEAGYWSLGYGDGVDDDEYEMEDWGERTGN